MTTPASFLPSTRQAWLRLSFYALETLVLSMTVRDLILRIPSMHGEQFSHGFYITEVSAIALLALSSFLIRRWHRNLSIVGWVTSLLALLWCSVETPVY